MKVFVAKILTVAAVVCGTILSASGVASAAGLPAQAPVTASAQFSNLYGNGGPFLSIDAMYRTARDLAEYQAKLQCASGAIRYKHLVVTNQSYTQDRINQRQNAVVEISTMCW